MSLYLKKLQWGLREQREGLFIMMSVVLKPRQHQAKVEMLILSVWLFFRNKVLRPKQHCHQLLTGDEGDGR